MALVALFLYSFLALLFHLYQLTKTLEKRSLYNKVTIIIINELKYNGRRI